jgi:hypothetical protein
LHTREEPSRWVLIDTADGITASYDRQSVVRLDTTACKVWIKLEHGRSREPVTQTAGTRYDHVLYHIAFDCGLRRAHVLQGLYYDSSGVNVGEETLQSDESEWSDFVPDSRAEREMQMVCKDVALPKARDAERTANQGVAPAEGKNPQWISLGKSEGTTAYYDRRSIVRTYPTTYQVWLKLAQSASRDPVPETMGKRYTQLRLLAEYDGALRQERFLDARYYDSSEWVGEKSLGGGWQDLIPGTGRELWMETICKEGSKRRP